MDKIIWSITIGKGMSRMNEKELMVALPIVAELSRKYTSGESTSVTYETGNRLMGAVSYCVEEYNNGDTLPMRQVEVSMREKYEIGRNLLLRKIDDCRVRYNELTTYFKAYGNHNYEDTVTKAISGFFIHYDSVFYPQNTIITCDYPTIIPVCDTKQTGIDLIDKYLSYIELEQSFLRKLPDGFIYDLLSDNDCDYENQFYNISAVVFGSLLGCMLIGKNIMKKSNSAYEQLFEIIQGSDEKKLRNHLDQASLLLLKNGYDNFMELHQYFQNEITELAVRLKQVKDVQNIKNILVL